MAALVLRITLPPAPGLIATRWVTEALRASAIKATSIIKTRTAAGVDANGRAFKPYSPRYAALKAATGRNASPVDLTLTGQMLGNLKLLRVQNRAAWIGFEGTHRVVHFSAPSRRGRRTLKRSRGGKVTNTSMAAVVLGNQRVRKFFAIERPEELRELVRVAQERIDQLIREAARQG